MRVSRLVVKEMLYRKLGFVLGTLCVAVAVGCLVGAVTVLKAHDLHTGRILASKEARTQEQMAALEDEVRKAMLRLGFNVVILPKQQDLGDWYAHDYGSVYMPQAYVDRLAASKIVTIRHLLPSLQQKVTWPEKKRTILLVGTRGEVPKLFLDPKRPLVQPVPDGTMVVGYELQQSLGLNVGDTVALLGREFTVHKCHEERGSKDDITVWIPLDTAQEILDKRGLISAILAVECQCAWADVSRVREEITGVLPDTHVVEVGSKALARAEARRRVGEEAKASLERERTLRSNLRGERERLATVLVVVVLAASAIWIGFLTLANVRERRSEIGIFRALGFRTAQILFLFLSKAVVMGLVGGALGFVLGFFAGRRLDVMLDRTNATFLKAGALFEPVQMVLALGLAVCLSAVASWIPAMLAAREDPADILREE